MRWHRLGEADLEACFALYPHHMGADTVGCKRALEAWRWMVHSPSFSGAIFEEETTPSERRLVGCGAAVFVHSSFAEEELADPRPGLNARIVSSIADCRPVALTYEQLREGNAHATLQLAVLAGAFDDQLREEEIWAVTTVMSEVFVSHFVGFNIARILYEAIGPVEIGIHTATTVSRTVRMFDGKRALMNITPESAASVTGSQISTIFLKRRPILRLAQAEQELLVAALDELTDEELSDRLNVHIGTVKKRWTKIFDRISSEHPKLIADCVSPLDEHVRGRQKRHRILAYVREHPEELRPYDYDRSLQSLGIGAV
ncbi:MAG TPA: hypothetical protein VFE35_05265 [Candidatus Cybelea sp.]|nr:hypothetical protein [Candidatus Cybelea sp.]